MIERTGRERLLEMLLAGTPDRIIDALTAASPDDRADLAELRETLASLGMSADPVRPPAALRERLLATRPRPRRPKRPVLLILDMIQAHLTPGLPLELPRARGIVPALQERIKDARESAIPVIYACDSHPPGDHDFRDWPEHAVLGTPGAEVWPELAPEPGDHVVPKRTYSAFTDSDLGPLLDRLRADAIVLTGCATEIGVFITAAEALQRGFVVTVPPDCQAGTSAVAEQVALLTLSSMPPFDPRYLRAES